LSALPSGSTVKPGKLDGAGFVAVGDGVDDGV